MRKMNVIAAMIVLGSTIQAAWAGDGHPDQTAGPATRPTVAALLQERIESAKTTMDVARELSRSGVVSSEEVILWTQRWAQARVDAAGSDGERIATLKELVDVAKAAEAEAEGRFRSGTANRLDTEAARYLRIDAELKLSRQLAQADTPAKDDKQLLQGTWKVVKKVKNGEPEELKATPATLKFSGNTVTLSEGGEQQGEGTFSIDESKTPRRITLTGTSGQNAGRTFEAIYALDGDTFKLAYGIGENAGSPPKDFEGGQGQAVEVLERQKP